MAEAILSPLLDATAGYLTSMIKDEVSLQMGVKNELKNLLSTMSTINAVLKDAEERQVKDKSVTDWLKKLKDVSYQVDNILDEYAIEALRWKAEHPVETRNSQVSNFLPCICFTKLVFRHSIGIQIRDVNERLRKITDERSNYHFRKLVSVKKVEIVETSSFVDEKKVLGRRGEKENIVDLLLSSDRDDAFVIPIVGMGGLGKTTLAQFVYNDERVEKHFQPRMWVCVSDEFEIKRLINKAIISSGTENTCGLDELEPLQRKFRELLSGRRFLLVLDDVWNEDQDKWESLIDLLGGGENGSRIIVTTRSEKVSPIMVPTTTVHLECLSEDDCWSLFTQRAFRERIEEVHPNLIAIGKEIVNKCSGIPLAAKSLGSMMHFKREESEWQEIRDSETWDLLDDERGILNALRISYNNLPPYLKQCFVYCCVYPKDHEIIKEELIRLWMAQGFIQPSKGSSRQLEDIGSEYFNDLLWRSFFQDVERDDDGKIVSCKMHDLVHDLAQSVANDEYRIIQFGGSDQAIDYNNKAYHLSLVCDAVAPPNILDGLFKSSQLRTFLGIVELVDLCPKLPIGSVLNLRYLRVLDLSFSVMTNLPDSIDNLIHLRYLSLRGTDIESLPETICSLCNMQTLNLEFCFNFSKLPEGLKNMISLRHLEMNGIRSMDCMPRGIGRLTCLQTLPMYIVGKEEGRGLGELQDLNLRGTLKLGKLENVKNMEEAEMASLKRKQHLHTLEFRWSYERENNGQEEERVLEGLRPHTHLRNISISCYGGSKFPSWMRNSTLANLVSISLYEVSSCGRLPPFGKLMFLKELKIYSAYGIKYLSDGSYGEGNTVGFPSLVELSLSEMCNLEDWWSSGEGHLRCLHKLYIVDCPKLRRLPKLPSLEDATLERMPNFEDWSTTGEGNLSCLRKLYIRHCPKVITLPYLPSLEKLVVAHMPNLEGLWKSGEGNLSHLRDLVITDCPKLALQELPSLEEMSLSDMPSFDDWSIIGEGNLSRLCKLSIDNLPELWALPQITNLKQLNLNYYYGDVTLDHFPSLENLAIGNCIDFTWLQSLENLSTLKRLDIYQSPQLESLPEGLKHLAALEQINIYGCPLLIERCKEGGEDWHKIAHICNKSIR